MTTGRPPTPPHLRLAKGVNKKDPGRENNDAPDVAPDGLGDPPAHLSKQAAEVWKRDAPWWAGETDRPLFAQYATATADAEHFYEVCETEGWFFETDKGTIMRHPASTLYNENRQTAIKLGAQFGMNPTDRQRIKVRPKRKASPADEFRKPR